MQNSSTYEIKLPKLEKALKKNGIFIKRLLVSLSKDKKYYYCKIIEIFVLSDITTFCIDITNNVLIKIEFDLKTKMYNDKVTVEVISKQIVNENNQGFIDVLSSFGNDKILRDNMSKYCDVDVVNNNISSFDAEQELTYMYNAPVQFTSKSLLNLTSTSRQIRRLGTSMQSTVYRPVIITSSHVFHVDIQTNRLKMYEIISNKARLDNIDKNYCNGVLYPIISIEAFVSRIESLPSNVKQIMTNLETIILKVYEKNIVNISSKLNVSNLQVNVKHNAFIESRKSLNLEINQLTNSKFQIDDEQKEMSKDLQNTKNKIDMIDKFDINEKNRMTYILSNLIERENEIHKKSMDVVSSIFKAKFQLNQLILKMDAYIFDINVLVDTIESHTRS